MEFIGCVDKVDRRGVDRHRFQVCPGIFVHVYACFFLPSKQTALLCGSKNRWTVNVNIHRGGERVVIEKLKNVYYDRISSIRTERNKPVVEYWVQSFREHNKQLYEKYVTGINKDTRAHALVCTFFFARNFKKSDRFAQGYAMQWRWMCEGPINHPWSTGYNYFITLFTYYTTYGHSSVTPPHSWKLPPLAVKFVSGSNHLIPYTICAPGT